MGCRRAGRDAATKTRGACVRIQPTHPPTQRLTKAHLTQAEAPQPVTERPTTYLVGGEANLEEEDEEYRRIWDLPGPPLARGGPSGDDPALASCALEPLDSVSQAAVAAAPPVATLADAPSERDGSAAPEPSHAAASLPSATAAAVRGAEATAPSARGELLSAALPAALPAHAWAAQARAPDNGASAGGAACAAAPSREWEAPPLSADALVASWADASVPLTLPDAIAAPHRHTPAPTPTPAAAAAVAAATHPPPHAASCGARVLSLLSLLGSALHLAMQAMHHGGVGLLQAHQPRRLYHHVFVEPHSRRCVRQCVLLDVLLFRGAVHVHVHARCMLHVHAWCMVHVHMHVLLLRGTLPLYSAPTTSMLCLLYLLYSTDPPQGALLLYEHALPALCRALLSIELRGDWRCA